MPEQRAPWENPALTDAERVALMPPELRRRAERLARYVQRAERGEYAVTIETALIARRGS